MKLRFLGVANSAGIPVHNCQCSVCVKFRKNNKVNLCTCAYIEINNKIILLDAGIENISNIFDGKEIVAIFLTHFHADHCLGLLRLRYSIKSIDCFHPLDKEGFSDLFKYKKSLHFQHMQAFETKVVEGISFTALPLKHSKNCHGYFVKYKNKAFAYLTDCYEVPKETMDFLYTKKLDYAFVDACYDERISKGNHLNYVQASHILESLHVKNGYLMHISHETQEYIEKNNVLLQYPYVQSRQCF